MREDSTKSQSEEAHMRGTLVSRNPAWVVAAFAIAIGIAMMSPSRKPSVPEVDVVAAKALIDSGATVIDVREKEVSAGSHIAGAMLIPLSALSQSLNTLALDRTKPIVVYCNEGTSRGPDGTAALHRAGYTNAVNLKSGIEGWRAAGLPTSSNKDG